MQINFTQQNLEKLLHEFEGFENNINPNELIKELLDNPLSKDITNTNLIELRVLTGKKLQEMLFDFGSTDRTLTFEERKEVAYNISKIDIPDNYYYMDYSSTWVPIDNYLIVQLLNRLISTFE